LRSFPSRAKLFEVAASRRRVAAAALLLAGLGGVAYRARGELPEWVREVVGASATESALYRWMETPGAKILYPRPPAEAREELSNLLAKAPAERELYALRARVDEQSLDFTAAESDWKLYLAHAENVPAANLDLADFYHRRLRSEEEVATLLLVGAAPSTGAERFIPAPQQRSWRAFERVLKVADDQALPLAIEMTTYRAWIARYPQEPSLYAALVNLLIERQQFDEADNQIAEYRRTFPEDEVFPLRAAALIEYRRGASERERAIGLYENSFRPLWPAELVQSYFAILSATHQQRKMLSDARARLTANPDDLAAAVRIFYYYQQEGRIDAARKALEEYRFNKDRRMAAWSAEELYTLATLLDRVNQYDEGARYYFALYSAQGNISASRSPQEVALAGIVRILLTAPDQTIALGSGNLSIYSDIATVDSGPGYLNGILSLWLNSESPRQQFDEEEKRGLPYFHRAKAAELLALLDKKFPGCAARADLHAELIGAYAGYGLDATVIKAGSDFLKEYPDSPRRIAVAMLMADAYSRTNNTTAEFELYDHMLSELGAKSGGMPLTASATSAPTGDVSTSAVRSEGPLEGRTDGETTAAKPTIDSALALTASKPAQVIAPDELTYGQLLNRYLGRLSTEKKAAEALAVLRHELDRNPDDPLLYQRLADFLEQNNFNSQEEEVYRRAIERFNSRDWYDRLARLLIREKRRQDYSALTRQVVDTFRGTELESYFSKVDGGWPQISLEVNLYAHQRFPHDTTFTLNLLRAYRSRNTADPVAWEKLMREHWFESPQLTNEFFDYLSFTGKLDGEIAALRRLLPEGTKPGEDSAAVRELAEADLWQSHFEQSAPLLGSLESDYPADAEIGSQASSVYRSLAYFDPSTTARAVAIENNLLAYDPADRDRLARIGDILADRADGDASQLAAAAPYWRRMASVHPGSPDGYLQAATIFWDYFQFDDALQQIAAARKQFHDPALYGYEAGAIYENERETGKAVDEYVTAAVTGNSAAHARLVTLAARPASARLVDRASARAVADHPTLLAIDLRADILGKQMQTREITALVDHAVDRASTFDEAEQLASFAQQRNLTASYRRALRREADLVSDPVQRIEIQYSLVQSLDAMGDVDSAGQVIDAVYRDNSKIVGVVRTTTDFYWGHKQPGKATATLTQASRDAYPELARSYTFEAAEKSNENGDYAVARQLIAPLCNADPYGPNSARCVAITADGYARANDDSGLRDFYLARLAALKSEQMSPSERRDQAALLRPGLILALTRMKDYAGAVDQQIALIAAFPEDSAVIQDAALYALRYGRQQQLLDFLHQAIAGSPRDSRFAIALGSVDALFEDYPGAIDAYGKAIAIRKDRSDIYIARAGFEERLQRFDDAFDDYARLYLLTYKDPQWMVKAAEARARQGRNADAVQALQTAWVEGRPAEAANYFRVAEQLEKWNLLDAARGFAEQGVKQAGDDLLAADANHHGAAIYARVLTRERRSRDALNTLEGALNAAEVSPSSPAMFLQQAEKQGIAAVSDADWRRNRVEQRKRQAEAGFRETVQQMSAAVASYFTPEEKLAYAQLLDVRAAKATPADVVSIWIPAAMTAGLKDLEARWRKAVLLGGKSFDDGQLNAFSLLEKQRMENTERGKTLEKYADIYPQSADLVRAFAEDAWRDEANPARELAVLRRMDLQNKPQANLRERYFELLLRSEPDKLVEQASIGPADYADAAVNYALARGTMAIAYASIAARSANLQPVWREANTALVGLYFSDKAPAIGTAFRTSLDDRNIGERILTKTDTSVRLTGNSWFYYGMRYGVYRSFMQTGSKAGGAEDYLAAGLEGAPNAVSSYLSLAQAYTEAKDTPAALREYGHALELAPATAAIHRDIGLLLWPAGRKDEADRPEAIGHWKQALEILGQLVDTRVVPESFWSDFAAIAGDCHSRGLIGQLRPQMDTVLRTYIAKNGDYRTAELLRSALIASTSPSDGVDWILSLAEAARYPETLLSQLDDAVWMPRQQLGRVLRRELELAQPASPPADDPSGYLNGRVRRIRLRLFQYLVEERQDAEAQTFYASIPEKERTGDEFQRFRIVLSAHQGQLPKLLADFSSDPDKAPSTTAIAAAANQLHAGGDRAANRLLLEYVLDFNAVRHELTDADFLGLAQARLETGETTAAADLLHRFTLFAPDFYASLDSAAGLLEKSRHPTEALPFLTTLANSTPWKPEYRLRLAIARLRAQTGSTPQDIQPTVAELTGVASSDEAGYTVRVRAAVELKGRGATHDLHSAELALLASGKAIPQEQADKPYFLPARVAAARSAPTAVRPTILRKANSVAPSDALRLDIFRTEFALGNSELALATIQPMLESPEGYVQAVGALSSVPSDSDSGESDADGQVDSADDGTGQSNLDALSSYPDSADATGGSAAYAPVPWLLKTPKEKVNFALAVAALYERTGNHERALSYAQFAGRLNRDVNRRVEIARRVAALWLGVQTERENSSRRPAIHESLDQAIVVRPRISNAASQQVQP